MFTVAASSEFLARATLECAGSLIRWIDSEWLSQRAFNVAASIAWPDVRLKPRTTLLWRDVEARIRPHVGEYDLQCLFSRKLLYEPEVFEALANALQRYDVVVEIGANVGVYTLFMTLFGEGGLRVVCLEPSSEAFDRLKDNLRLNHRTLGDRRVVALNCAMSDRTGVQRFYEPLGHLSNGSFDREFASRFSESVRETQVVCVGPAELRELVGDDPARVLIKLDCEGAEPVILASLGSLLRDWRADLLVEITDATAAAMNDMGLLTELYEKFQITSDGLSRFDRFESSAAFRDWFLQARANR